MDSAKKTADMGKGGVKNPEKLPTSFMDGPLTDSQITFDLLESSHSQKSVVTSYRYN